jgi:hypothetical protein
LDGVDRIDRAHAKEADRLPDRIRRRNLAADRRFRFDVVGVIEDRLDEAGIDLNAEDAP